MNQSAIERGLFRTVMYRTYKSEQSMIGFGTNQLNFIKPSIVQKMKIKVDDSILQQDGLPYLAAYLEEGNAIIGQIARNLPKIKGNNFTE